LHITILTYGSRGDVQPYIALGRGLQAAGHDVTLACPAGFEAFVSEHGLGFHPLPGDPATLARELVDRAGNNPLATMQVFMDFALPLATAVMREAETACRGAEGIVAGFPMNLSAQMLSETLGIPQVSAMVLPIFTPTGAFTAPVYPPLENPFFNKFSHMIFGGLFWHTSRMVYNRLVRPRVPGAPWLRRWPFSPGKAWDVPAVYGVSSMVLAQPADWPARRHMTGYWVLDTSTDYQPPTDLADFLEAGSPPVYVGFGSMITQDRDWMQAVVLEALALSGQRAVLLGGWGGFSGGVLPGTIFPLESAPHEWLFSRMVAVVHHGGAGTTAASLRSGMPTIVVPFTADQPFWGNQVFRLGVGPQPIPKKKLTAVTLAAAITLAVSDESMRERAAVLGAEFRKEDGVREAVGLIERYLGT
jgi:UDP:flavonoid glycosyltransferase YjiC (YdhE family)